jgi:hypothetical protein
MKVDATDRKKLEELASERLLASADDEEQWSFVFGTEGAVDLLYCPWSVTEDEDFNGETDGLDLPWTPERLDLITRGEAEPTEEELRQWRRALCRKLADGSDWCWVAWIVPLWIDGKIAGHALFSASAAGDPDEAPLLGGVFESFDEAKAALSVEGAIDGE